MNVRSARYLLPFAALTASLLSCAFGAPPEDIFAGTTKIVLEKDLQKGPAKKTAEIVDAAEIAKFVAAVKLQTKNPCACEHIQSAVFTTPARAVTVSLCDHCFDFDGKTYAMPAGFYKLFNEHFEE